AARFERSGRALLRAHAVFVLALLRDRIALRDVLGGLQHRPVDFRLVLDEPAFGHHVAVHLVLHAPDRLHAAPHEPLPLAGYHALRGERDRLQPRRAEAVDRHARYADRQPGAQRDLARDIAAGRAFRIRATHDHVFDARRVEPRALDDGLRYVAAECRAVRH